MLSLEYDEIKQIINKIDEKWFLLKQIQSNPKRMYSNID